MDDGWSHSSYHRCGLVHEAEPMGSIKDTLKLIDDRTSSKCRSPCWSKMAMPLIHLTSIWLLYGDYLFCAVLSDEKPNHSNHFKCVGVLGGTNVLNQRNSQVHWWTDLFKMPKPSAEAKCFWPYFTLLSFDFCMDIADDDGCEWSHSSAHFLCLRPSLFTCPLATKRSLTWSLSKRPNRFATSVYLLLS